MQIERERGVSKGQTLILENVYFVVIYMISPRKKYRYFIEELENLLYK